MKELLDFLSNPFVLVIATAAITHWFNQRQNKSETNKLNKEAMAFDVSFSQYLDTLVEKRTQSLQKVIIDNQLEHQNSIDAYTRRMTELKELVQALRREVGDESRKRNECMKRVGELQEEINNLKSRK